MTIKAVWHARYTVQYGHVYLEISNKFTFYIICQASRLLWVEDGGGASIIH